MTAREWLASVTLAARALRAEEMREELARVAALGLGSSLGSLPHAHGISDKMAAVDALIDSEKDAHDRKIAALDDLARAREVFDGLRSVGWMEAEAANVLESVHVNLMPKTDIAEAVHESYSTIRRRYDYGVEWLDAHGIAHAREGIGSAT